MKATRSIKEVRYTYEGLQKHVYIRTIYIYTYNIYVCIHIHVYIYIYIHIYTHIYMHIYMYIYMHIYICV